MDPYTQAATLLLSLIERAAGLYRKLRADAMQNQAWTPEQAKAFDDKLAAAQQSPAWQPDKS